MREKGSRSRGGIATLVAAFAAAALVLGAPVASLGDGAASYRCYFVEGEPEEAGSAERAPIEVGVEPGGKLVLPARFAGLEVTPDPWLLEGGRRGDLALGGAVYHCRGGR
jgi:hypothetical protein